MYIKCYVVCIYLYKCFYILLFIKLITLKRTCNFHLFVHTSLKCTCMYQVSCNSMATILDFFMELKITGDTHKHWYLHIKFRPDQTFFEEVRNLAKRQFNINPKSQTNVIEKKLSFNYISLTFRTSFTYDITAAILKIKNLIRSLSVRRLSLTFSFCALLL